MITDTGPYETTVSGVFTFASESSLGGSLLLNMTVEDGQTWFDMAGRVSEIDVQAADGVDADELAGRIRAALPEEAEVKTGEQAAADQSAEISDAIGSFLNPVLLSLGGVAVLVGAFIIFNAFTMTVTQRRREFAMLRALGASRRQVLLSITGEALVMGVLASLVGLVVGLGFAAGVNALMKALDVDIPLSGLAMEPRTVVVGLAVGVSITLLSALAPALRATRVPPVAALQEGATLPPSRYARFSPYIAAAVAALGVAGVVNGMYGVGTTTQRLLAVAAGAVLIFVAIAMLSKYFVAPVAGFIGWPLQRLARTSGRLARDNSMRNPARTAATASALMIGLGVVVFVAVFAQGLKSSFIDSFDEVVQADYIIAGANFLPLPADTVRRVESVPDVVAAAGIDVQQVQVDDNEVTRPALYAVDPYVFERVWTFDWVDGEDELLLQLGNSGAIVEQQTADALALRVGERFEVLTAEGTTTELEVLGVYRDPMMINGVTVSTAAYDDLFPRRQPFMVVRLDRGALRDRRGGDRGRSGRRADGRRDDRRRVQGQHRRSAQPAPQPALRTAGDERDHLALRHHQHARAVGLRAHARDRPAARHRRLAAPDPAQRALRERDHLGDRRRARHRRRRRLRLRGDDALRRHGHQVRRARRCSSSSSSSWRWSPAWWRRSCRRGARRASTSCEAIQYE